MQGKDQQFHCFFPLEILEWWPVDIDALITELF